MGNKLVKLKTQPEHECEKTELDQNAKRLNIAGGHGGSRQKIGGGPKPTPTGVLFRFHGDIVNSSVRTSEQQPDYVTFSNF